MRSDTTEDLQALGYHPRWLECGLLDAVTLADQAARLRRGVDPSAEHYRWESFQRATIGTLSDQRVDDILELAALDPNPEMAKGAVNMLIQNWDLTDSQFVAARGSPLAFPRIVRRAELFRLLRRSDLGLAQLLECSRDGDQVVHRALLDRADLPIEVVELLAAKGANKAVRNMARQRTQRRQR